MEPMMTLKQGRPALHIVRLRAGSAMALALLAAGLGGLAPGAARAQAFQGTPSVVSGSAFFNTGPGTTTVTVSSPQAVVNWAVPASTTGNTATFLPAGTTATFQNNADASITGYTVLNNVQPVDVNGAAVNQSVAFNGTVQSFFGTAVGGNVWFYSPTGIVVGAGAAFNVGSLVLTTDAIDTTNGLYTASGQDISFTGAASHTSSVVINAGAQITAAGPSGTYLAIVSPRIVQGGTISANGSIGLVAAEAADITINAGLLNIAVTTGTQDANGIVHTGSTGGPATTSAATQQVLQMIAIPQNTALTMLLSGTIGYTAASSAANEGSSVVLTAGTPLDSLGNIDIGTQSAIRTTEITNALTINASNAIAIQPYDAPVTFDNAVTATAGGDFDIAPLLGQVVFANALTATAGNNVNVLPQSGGVDFQSGASLTAPATITLNAPSSATIQSEGDLNLTAGAGGAPGTIALTASYAGPDSGPAGRIAVTTALNLFAQGTPLTDSSSLDATGGTVSVTASGGAITAGQMFVNVAATGGPGYPGNGGNGFGGTVTINANSAGTIGAQSLSVTADGTGGPAYGGSAAGNGTGGSVTLSSAGAGSQLDFGLAGSGYTAVGILARGNGGYGYSQSGNATGGSILIDIAGGAQTWTSLYAVTDATGGPSYGYGISGSASGLADAITLNVRGGASLHVTGDAILSSHATVGNDGLPGYSATGGGTFVAVGAGSALTVDGTLSVHSDASFAPFDQDGNPLASDTSPTLQGGTASLIATGGTVNVGNGIDVEAFVDGLGAATSAGTVTGGTAIVGAQAGGSIVAATNSAAPNGPSYYALYVGAAAYGGDGPAPANAFGGTATLYENGGSITATGTADVTAVASASSNAGLALNPGTGYNATGGTASVQLRSGTGAGSMSFTDLFVDAGASSTVATEGGVVAAAGNGGTGTGGYAKVSVAQGQLTATSVSLEAVGDGEASAANFQPVDGLPVAANQSGNGIGGTASFTISGGTANVGVMGLNVEGTGGGGGTASLPLINGPGGSEVLALAGSGQGGTATFTASGGSLTASSLLLDAGALSGGAGMNDATGIEGAAGGNGGNATGGTAAFVMPAGSTGNVSVTGTTYVESFAIGGNGGTAVAGPSGNGGLGQAGSAQMTLADGAFTLGDTYVLANGTGGTGNLGGNGLGGSAGFVLNDTVAGQTLTRNLASLTLRAQGYPGASAVGLNATDTAGTTALTARVGSAGSAVSVTGNLLVEAAGAAVTAGNAFTGNLAGAAFSVGGTTTITTTGNIGLTSASGAPLATTGALTITTAGTLTGSGPISAGGNTDIIAPLGISLGTLQSGGTIQLTASSGPLVVSNLLATGLITALGTSVNIGSSGALDFTSAVATAGGLTIDTGGDLTVQTGSATGTVNLTATGNMNLPGVVSGSAIVLNSGGNIQNLGALQATGSLTATAKGNFYEGGLALGQAIAISSSQIGIGGEGQIGRRGVTQTLSLTNNNPANITYIGGTGIEGNYYLSPANLQQIFADKSITIAAQGASAAGTGGPGNVIVGSFALGFGAQSQIGTGGTLKITAPGLVTVNGAVKLTTSSASDLFSIDPTTIDLVADTGSITMLNGQALPLGQLSLSAGTIAVATSSVLSQLAKGGSAAQFNQLLGMPSTVPSNGGYLQASQLSFAVTNALYIQNSGLTAAFADRRGFTAYGVSITTGGPDTSIVINGQTLGTGGYTAVGGATASDVLINGYAAVKPGNFDPQSTINGCYIGLGCSLDGDQPPNQTVINTLTQPGGNGGSDNNPPLVTQTDVQPVSVVPLVDQPINTLPLIDEPVTGVGNDDLWKSPCGQGGKCANP